MTAMLPPEFADLERFSQWCLATEPQRFEKRLASSMAEMQAFYDAITPRAEEAISFCDKFSLDDIVELGKSNVVERLHLGHRGGQPLGITLGLGGQIPVEIWL
jgi:hypothetical protein